MTNNEIIILAQEFDHKDIEKIKINGVVFTPLFVVKQIINNSNPKITDKICEPSVGKGIFIFALIDYFIEKQHNINDIANFISNNLYCFETNPDFVNEMRRFTDSVPVVPLNVMENYGGGYENNSIGEIAPYYIQGNAKLLDQIARSIKAVRIITIGDTIYVQRVAQDCGPNDEVRYELVQVGKKAEIAEGTFAVYGKVIYSGSVSNAVMENNMALSGGV